MDSVAAGILGIVLLIVLLLFGLHIGWALGIVGFLGLLCLMPASSALNAIFTLPFGKVNSYSLTVIPLFILMGNLAFAAGVGNDAFNVGYKWFGRLPGGLAVATTFTSAAFAAVTGSSVAASATVGKVAIPEMRKYGYSDKLNCGSVAACGTLGVLIPPSIILVVYGITVEQSIGDLFLAGFIPGICTAILFAAMIVVRSTMDKTLGPASKENITWKDRFASFPKLLPVVILFILVLGGIYLGIFTPTEAAAAGCFAALLILLVRVRTNRKQVIWHALLEAVATTGMLYLIIIGVTVFSTFLGISTIPNKLSEMLLALPLPTTVILIFILLMYIPLGMFLDPLGIIFITMPIVYPAIIGLGYDGIWFGIIVTKLIEIGLITPPVGINVFTVRSIAPDVPLEDIFKGIFWFMIMDFIMLGLLIIFPQIALWLPYSAG